MGWERPNFFAPAGATPTIEYSFGRLNWHAWSGGEHRACREAVALFDMTSFSKFVVKGRDAETVLQHMVANDVAVPVAGRQVGVVDVDPVHDPVVLLEPRDDRRADSAARTGDQRDAAQR